MSSSLDRALGFDDPVGLMCRRRYDKAGSADRGQRQANFTRGTSSGAETLGVRPPRSVQDFADLAGQPAAAPPIR
jgi:hypothetical protein